MARGRAKQLKRIITATSGGWNITGMGGVSGSRTRTICRSNPARRCARCCSSSGTTASHEASRLRRGRRMRMAERSAEERIELWYRQFDHALKMARDQFYSNAMAIYVQPALSLADHIERFREAGELVGLRADYLRDNPAEVVQDRREAFAARAWDILQRTAEHPRAPSRADSPGEEAQGGAPAPPRP